MKYINKTLIVVLCGLGIFISCAAPARPEIKPRNLWVGFWYISEEGFEKAKQDQLVVQLREDGEFFTGYHDGFQFIRTMASGKWNVVEDKFLDVREYETLESSYEIVSDTEIILSIDPDQKLYMLRREKQ